MWRNVCSADFQSQCSRPRPWLTAHRNMVAFKRCPPRSAVSRTRRPHGSRSQQPSASRPAFCRVFSHVTFYSLGSVAGSTSNNWCLYMINLKPSCSVLSMPTGTKRHGPRGGDPGVWHISFFRSFFSTRQCDRITWLKSAHLLRSC